MATMPAITLTTVSVMRMPTLNASSTEDGRRPAQHDGEEGLLGADAAGRGRHQRGEAERHLHEQRVADRLVDPERAEEEPDRGDAERPVAQLPRDDACAASAAAGA